MVATNYLVTLLVLILGTLLQQGFTQTPEVRTAIEGGHVVLRCDAPYDRTEDFYWSETNISVILYRPAGAGADVNDVEIPISRFRGRLTLVGVDSVDLRIDNVTMADEGSYNCQQKHADQKGTLQRLQVLKAVPPDPAAPTISGYSGGFLTPGSNVTLTCVSTGARPPANLIWWTGDTQLEANNSFSTTDPLEHGDTTSKVTIADLQLSDNGRVLQCRASHRALAQVETSEITLNVAYGPRDVTVTCDPHDLSDLWEGGALECTCTADSNPAARYSWLKGTTHLSSAVVDSETGMLTYPTLHVAQSGEYRCVAENAVGSQTSDSITINIKGSVMSAGAIAGIVIGLVALCIIAIVIYVQRRKSGRRLRTRFSTFKSEVGERLASGEEKMEGLLDGIQQDVRRRDEDLKAGKDDVGRLVTEMKDLKAEKAEADEHLDGLAAYLNTGLDDLHRRVERLEMDMRDGSAKDNEVVELPDKTEGHHKETALDQTVRNYKTSETDSEQSGQTVGTLEPSSDESTEKTDQVVSMPDEKQGAVPKRTLPGNAGQSVQDGACGGVRLDGDAPLTNQVMNTEKQGTPWTDLFKIVENTLPPENWLHLAKVLGVSNKEISSIDRAPFCPSQGKLHQLLWQWRVEEDEAATPEALAAALCKCGFDDVADIVKKRCQTYYRA